MLSAPVRSILIVEDEGIVAADLRAMLIDMGYDAYAVCASGAGALERATERPPDLALMDINIKGAMDGVETAALLRARFGTAIVFLTAFAYDSTSARIQRSEPHAYLVKPVTATALQSTIELSLHRHDLEQRLRYREQELARNNVQLSTLIDHIQSGVLFEDERRRIQHTNRQLCSMFQTAGNPQELKGTDGAQLIQSVKDRFVQPDQFVSGIERLLQGRESVSGELVELSDGRVFERDFVPMLSDNVYQGQLWTYRDVTERELDRKAREQSSQHNRRLSMIDELTGLHNRRGFLLLGEQHLKGAHRGDLRNALFYLDLNNLKKINDSFGHDLGDQAIRDMAAVLRKTFRTSDVLGRLGGDEFVVLGEMDASHMPLTSSRLRRAIAAFNAEGGRPYALDTSIGVVLHAPEETLDQLLARGDAAMYQDKRAYKQVSG